MSETKIFLTVLFLYNALNILNLFSLTTTRLYIQGYNLDKVEFSWFFFLNMEVTYLKPNKSITLFKGGEREPFFYS